MLYYVEFILTHMKLHSKFQKSFLIFFILFLTLFTISIPSSIAEESEKKNVLILHAYHKGFPWTDNINLGIEDSFSNFSDSIELTIEYMDSKANIYNSTYKEQLLELYQYKYGNKKFDLIISSDDNAIDFLREYGDQLFPDTPIVFCGVNNLEIPELVDRNLVTGLLEITADKETLDLMLSLHPSTNEVVIISDNTPSGIYRLEQLINITAYYQEIKFVYLNSNYTLNEIEAEVAQLSQDSIILFCTFYRDSLGTYYSLEEGISRVSSASLSPIYGLHSQCLPYGIIGGKLLSGYNHGQIAASLGIRILNGEDPLSIPIIEGSTAQYMFNYEQLERFNVDIKDLPPDSIILNQPFSFYKTYTTLIWVVTGFATILFSIITLLGININKRIHLEYEIKEANEELELRVKERTEELNELLDQEKIYKEQLLKSSQFKSEFMASMSHELRTPLNSIIGFTDVILERISGEINEEQDKYLNNVKSSSLLLLDLINDVLDIAKIEAGKVELYVEDVNINQIISQVNTMLKPTYEKKNLKLEMQKFDKDKVIRVDRLRFKEILFNLLSNAVKYTKSGGVKLEILENEDDWVINIIDTGIGIAKEDSDIIFKEFKRVKSEYTNSIEGTGLGLPLTKKFIELHGGNISFTSEFGKGSTFSFTIPKS